MKRLWKRSLLLTAALMAVSIAIAFFLSHSAEPSFAGRSLTQWSRQLANRTSTAEDRDRATQAIRRIGTNAIPKLLHDLSGQGANLPWQLLRESTTERQNRAMQSFQALGDLALPGVPAISNLLREPNPKTVYRAAVVLSHIRPEGLIALEAAFDNNERSVRRDVINILYQLATDQIDITPAIPMVLRCLDDADRDVAYWAAATIARYGSDGEKVVPELQKKLSSSNAICRAASIIAMRGYPNELARLVDPVSRLLKDPDPNVREAAQRTLEEGRSRQGRQ